MEAGWFEVGLARYRGFLLVRPEGWVGERLCALALADNIVWRWNGPPHSDSFHMSLQAPGAEHLAILRSDDGEVVGHSGLYGLNSSHRTAFFEASLTPVHQAMHGRRGVGAVALALEVDEGVADEAAGRIGAVAALLFGAALGLAGAIFQNLTRNPLGAPDIIGIDANPNATEIAGTDLVRTMRAEALDFPDDSFDAIVSVHAIEHIPELEEALVEMGRVLRPGGRAMFIYPAEPIQGLFAIPTSVILHGTPFKAREVHCQKLWPSKLRSMVDGLGWIETHHEFNLLRSPQFVSQFAATV